MSTIERETSLPKYISFRGHGMSSVPVPITTTDATLYAFAFRSDPAAVQQLVDATLNQVAPDKYQYVVLGHHVLLTYMHCVHCVSPANIGWQGDHETAFFVPLMQKPTSGDEWTKLVLWVPYLLIDSPFGLLTGREVWGFNKTYGATTMPKDPGDDATFVSATDISATLDNSSPVEFTTLVTLAREGKLGALQATYSDHRALLSDIEKNLGPWTISWKDVLEMGIDLLKSLFDREVPFINVKQMRDATFSRRAALMQLVETNIQPALPLLGAGLMPSGFDLTITPCDSHPIAADLGLLDQNPDKSFPATFGFWVKMNWEAGPGTIVCQVP
jgi:hypothetical protein